MSKKDEAKQRARYTLEFKLEAVRLVKAGQEVSVTAQVLGIPGDRRVVMVELSASGLTGLDGVRAALAEVMNDHLVGFSEAEWLELDGFLRRIAANCDRLARVATA